MSTEIKGRVCGATTVDVPDGEMAVEVIIPREHASRIRLSMPVTIAIPKES